MPISLSSSFKTYRVLFCKRTAAKQRAPSIPKEFLRIEPYYMPRLSSFICVFFIKSSRMRDNPTSLIMLLARFRFQILVLLIMFLIACIPYSLMELSAMLSYLNLYQIKNYCCDQSIDISFMRVFTPSLIDLRLRLCGYFFELTLLRLYLNIFAFQRSGFSPVSWHREKKISRQIESYRHEFQVQIWRRQLQYLRVVRYSFSSGVYSLFYS